MMSEKVFLDAAAILAVEDLPQEDVWVEEWGTWVHMQGMTGSQRDAFETSLQGKNGQIDQRNLRARLVAQCALNQQTGERLFSRKQVDALGQKSAKALTTLFMAAKDLSGFSNAEIEELEKNFESDQSDNSGSN
jgi:hypothetical protein